MPDPVTGLQSYDPNKIIGSLGNVDDSVAANVAKLTSQDSALNQMARSEGLKAANQRGLLNSSMAVGSAQDAVLKNVLPIAQQDAAQAAAKNAAARQFEYGLTSQEQAQGFQTGERLGTQQFQTGERVGAQEFQSAENVAQRGWQTAENLAQRNFQGTQADLDRDLQQTLQTQQLNTQQAMQIRQIASTEGIEAANRELQKQLQENDIQFRMKEGALDRQAAVDAQNRDIAFKQSESALDRKLQEQVAKWNLSSSDRNAASQMVTNAQTNYQTQYATIMNNTKLSATDRANQLNAAKNLRDTNLNLVEQMYNVDLSW